MLDARQLGTASETLMERCMSRRDYEFTATSTPVPGWCGVRDSSEVTVGIEK